MIQRAFAFALGTALAFASQVFAAESSAPRAKTSLIWLFGDDDLLRPASSTLPISHGLGFGDRSGYGAFFDSLGARDRGRESALVLHRSEHAEGLVRGLDTFAELNLSLLLGANAAALELEDRGTRLGIRWSAPALARAFELGLFPFDSDSVRLGALRELSFGGTDFRHADSSFPFAAPGIPALRARFEARAFSGFLAANGERGRAPPRVSRCRLCSAP